MAGVVCLNCRRSNPEGALFCVFCQAALNKPQPPVTPRPGSADEEPEWLRRVRERKEQDTTKPRTSGENVDSNLDAVLRRIGVTRDPLSGSRDDKAPPHETPQQAELLSDDNSGIIGVDNQPVADQDPDSIERAPDPLAESIQAVPDEGIQQVAPEEMGGDDLEPGAPVESAHTTADGITALSALSAELSPEPARPDQTPYTPVMPGLEEIEGALPGEEITYTESAPNPPNRSVHPQRVSFKETLQAERQPSAPPAYRRNRSSYVLRWLITGLLFGLISLAILGGTAPRSLPINIPLETASLYESLRGISPGAKILLVIGYQPAYSGEIETASGAVLRLLAERGSHFQVISTSSQNLFLANRLLDSARRNYPTQMTDYISGNGYDILGYLPGGPAGLRGLLTDLPANLAVGVDMKPTEIAFQTAGIQKLDDYDSILVLTDDPETARLWVEQISPDLSETRLWMAVSSQAVPLVRPYFRSGQVDGLVGGLYGAACLEQVLRETGPALRLWNGYENGLLIALFTILMGGILNFTGFSLIHHRKEGAR